MTLREKINAGQFVVCSEIAPPQSCDGNVIREHARQFKGVVDAVNVTDNQRAIVRLSSIASGKILLEEGIEPIIQVTCRDRNRLAIQGDLLGAAALGMRNVLCLTGDHQSFGDQPEAKGVFDLDSIQLIAAVDMMNRGYLLSGTAMPTAPGFVIGAAANPFGEPFEMRLIRLHKKVAAGVHFIQTQAVFDLELFARWMRRIVEMGLHESVAILPGVMPVRSAKTLQWMQEKLPGVRIPAGLLNRMVQARDPREEGARIAVETLRALKEIHGVRGVHIMPSLWEGVTATILNEAGVNSTQKAERP